MGVHFTKESGDISEIEFEFAVFQLQSDFVQIRLQTGLEEQVFINVVCQLAVSFAYGFEEAFHLLFALHIDNTGLFTRECVQCCNFRAQFVQFFFVLV